MLHAAWNWVVENWLPVLGTSAGAPTLLLLLRRLFRGVVRRFDERAVRRALLDEAKVGEDAYPARERRRQPDPREVIRGQASVLAIAALDEFRRLAGGKLESASRQHHEDLGQAIAAFDDVHKIFGALIARLRALHDGFQPYVRAAELASTPASAPEPGPLACAPSDAPKIVEAVESAKIEEVAP